MMPCSEVFDLNLAETYFIFYSLHVTDCKMHHR
jgi:hypothetical protein